MRLLPYILLGYLAVGLQVGLSGYVRLGGAAPNLVLIVAVFVALFAQRDVALLSCFVLGLMQDLLTQQTLGLYAFSYGLTAMLITSSASMLYRQHPLTHAAVVLAASMQTWFLLLIHGWIFNSSPGFASAAMSTLVTSVLAAPVMWLLIKLRPMLGMRVPRKWT